MINRFYPAWVFLFYSNRRIITHIGPVARRIDPGVAEARILVNPVAASARFDPAA